MVKQEALTHQQLDALLAAAKEISVRTWALILLLYSHGLRAAEVGNIDVRKDLNMKDWTLTVTRGKKSRRIVHNVYQHSNKLRNERRAIEEWMKIRPDSPYLFANRQGQPLSRISVFKIVKEAADAAGLPAHSSSPHALKHSLGQHLRESGSDVYTVANALGHKRVDSAAQYFRDSFQDVNEARRKAIASN